MYVIVTEVKIIFFKKIMSRYWKNKVKKVEGNN